MFTDITPKFLFIHTGYEDRLDKSHIKIFNDLVEDTEAQFQLVAVKADQEIVFNLTDPKELNPVVLKQMDKSIAVFKVDDNYMDNLNQCYLHNRVYCASYSIYKMKYDVKNEILFIELDSENG